MPATPAQYAALKAQSFTFPEADVVYQIWTYTGSTWSLLNGWNWIEDKAPALWAANHITDPWVVVRLMSDGTFGLLT